ncbi:NTP/NDP exchange transporter [Mycetohabitans sp. B8]|uniref:NTP/NDP exchange transporter n=1 Tax=Mycetohabitans sp. B8 TaxID=2841845 RepID=UPI0034CD28C5
MRHDYFKLLHRISTGREQLRTRLKVRPEEARPLLWSALGLFFLSFSYYLIRPIRDTMAAMNGVQNLTWLFSATLLCMLLISYLFSILLSRFSLQRAVSISYRICIAVLFIFANWIQFNLQDFWIGKLFFVWVSAYSVFAMTMYWMVIIDKFSEEQGARLFGMVSAGANLGALAGSGLSTALSGLLSPGWTLLIAAFLLELVVRSTPRLISTPTESHQQCSKIACHIKEKRVDNIASGNQRGGNPILNSVATLLHAAPALRSPYVAGLCIYVVLSSVTSTALYFHQTQLVHDLDFSPEARIKLFASIDLASNALTLIIQLFFAGRIIRYLGSPIILAIIPATSVIGFGVLAWKPTITILMVFRVIFRVINFSLTQPVQETLFMVMDKKTRYKNKGFIDTVAHRLGDQLGAWAYAGMGGLGLSISVISFAMVPLSVFWLFNGMRLGRQHRRLAAAQSNPDSSSWRTRD